MLSTHQLVPSLPSDWHVSPRGPQPQSSCWHRSLLGTVMHTCVHTWVSVNPPGSMVFLTVDLSLLVPPRCFSLRDTQGARHTRTPPAPRPLDLLTCWSSLIFPRDHALMLCTFARSRHTGPPTPGLTPVAVLRPPCTSTVHHPGKEKWDLTRRQDRLH